MGATLTYPWGCPPWSSLRLSIVETWGCIASFVKLTLLSLSLPGDIRHWSRSLSNEKVYSFCLDDSHYHSCLEASLCSWIGCICLTSSWRGWRSSDPSLRLFGLHPLSSWWCLAPVSVARLFRIAFFLLTTSIVSLISGTTLGMQGGMGDAAGRLFWWFEVGFWVDVILSPLQGLRYVLSLDSILRDPLDDEEPHPRCPLHCFNICTSSACVLYSWWVCSVCSQVKFIKALLVLVYSWTSSACTFD